MTDDENVERATTFSADEAPSGERLDGSETYSNYYDRLSSLNSLRWNGRWRDESRERAIDGVAILDSIANQMALTDYQQEEAHRHFRTLPERLHQGYAKPLLAACTCAVTANQDGRDYHPRDIQRCDGSAFSELIEELGYGYRETYQCWLSVREAVR